MMPVDGVRDHVMPVLLVPETVAEYCLDWPGPRVAVVGVTETETVGGGVDPLGFNLMVTVAEAGGLLDVTWMVTEVEELIVVGAWYKPVIETVPRLELPPTTPFTDHVYRPVFPPFIVTVNCCI
jgi:hypothetical protein